VAAKCNITSLTIKKLNQLYWGQPPDSTDDAILENYLEQLGYCEGVDLIPCYEEDCVNDPIVVDCTLAISSIQSSISENVVTFSIPSNGITNGITPYTYQWDYEEDDFILSGPIGASTLILTVKPNKNINYLTSNISVAVTDANGCTIIKSCWLTPAGMQCTEEYAACVPPTLLTVGNKTVLCGTLSSLVVIKKL